LVSRQPVGVAPDALRDQRDVFSVHRADRTEPPRLTRS
jgi:hypothetical protein